MKNNRKGFTITELVIVIAVIAILAAVLIPTFSGIIEKANDSADLQEARSIMTQYVAYKDAKVEDEYYVKVDADTYFKVTKGELAKTPLTEAEVTTLLATPGKIIVSKDADNDQWPDEATVTSAPADDG